MPAALFFFSFSRRFGLSCVFWFFFWCFLVFFGGLCAHGATTLEAAAPKHDGGHTIHRLVRSPLPPYTARKATKPPAETETTHRQSTRPPPKKTKTKTKTIQRPLFSGRARAARAAAPHGPLKGPRRDDGEPGRAARPAVPRVPVAVAQFKNSTFRPRALLGKSDSRQRGQGDPDDQLLVRPGRRGGRGAGRGLAHERARVPGRADGAFIVVFLAILCLFLCLCRVAAAVGIRSLCRAVVGSLLLLFVVALVLLARWSILPGASAHTTTKTTHQPNQIQTNTKPK